MLEDVEASLRGEPDLVDRIELVKKRREQEAAKEAEQRAKDLQLARS
jgi:hypothetical protein